MEVLVDRYMRVTDVLNEIIEEMGTQDLDLDLSVASALKALPPGSSRRQRAVEERRAIEAEILRYRAEVEEPAFAILRERKASGGGRMCKEPVTFSSFSDYYPEILDGIDLRLPANPPAPPAVSFLTLEISLPPRDYLRSSPINGFISSCHDNFLAIYLGSYRPGIPLPGYYLVVDTLANSMAIVPPLPSSWVTISSHGSIGTGVAIQAYPCPSTQEHPHPSSQMYYVLAELYFRKEHPSDICSNKATMFMWWSPGSGPLADEWIQKEVVLSLPAHQDMSTATATATATAPYFRANMVLPVGTTALCWVDLWTGILVCNGIRGLADGSADDDQVFHFIPLPEECTIVPHPLFRCGDAEDSRSMCCVDPEHVVFVCMDDDKAMLTTWTLRSPLTKGWLWEKGPSLCIPDMLDRLPVSKGDPKLQQVIPRCPVICRQQPDAVHIFVTDLERKDEHGKWQVEGYYEFSANIHNGALLSVFEFPSSGIQPFPFASICSIGMSCFVEKKIV